VKDYVLGGVYEPVLGYFSINLQEAYKQSENLKRELKGENKSLSSFDKVKSIFSHVNAPTSGKLKNVHPKLISSLRAFVVQNIEYNWTIMTKNTKLNSLKKDPKKPIDVSTIVVFPSYVQQDKIHFVEEFRSEMKKNEEYMPVGHDSKEVRSLKKMDKRLKHYRFKIDCPYSEYYKNMHGTKLGLSS